MGIRYCMYCGMVISRKANICPECGNSLKLSAPKIKPQTTEKLLDLNKLLPKNRLHRRKQNNIALCFAVGLLAVSCGSAFFIMDVSGKIKRARSRHLENMMDEQRDTTTPHHEIKIPEMSMPVIEIPDIQIPTAPAAAFAVESYAVETNHMGETVLYVNINYTNKAETEECFLTNFLISVHQEGAVCRLTAGDPAKAQHLTERVQPDETVSVSEAFIIQADKEATVSVASFLGYETYLEETVFPHSDGTVSVSE